MKVGYMDMHEEINN